MFKIVLGIVCVVCLVSCKSTNRTPAVILVQTESSSNSRQVLQQSISSLMGGVSIEISHDAFVNEPELTIERARGSDAAQQAGTGRVYETPEHFKLWKQGDDCVVERVSTKRFVVLVEIDCSEYSE